MYRKKLICLITIVLVLGLGPSIPAEADTLCHWKFEGTIGSDIVSVTDDVSGKVVTPLPGTSLDPLASLTYGEPFPFFGFNSSAHFNNPVPDGSSNTGICLIVPDNNELDLAGTTGLTIEAFVKPFELRQAVIVRDYRPGNELGYWLDMRSGGDFSFHLGDGVTSLILPSGDGTVTVDEWHHVAGTWDGTTMRIYVNGLEENSASYDAGLVDNTGAFGIGAIVRWSGDDDRGSEGQYFNGLIDEVRISDTALAPEEFLNSDPTPRVQFESGDSSSVENSGSAQLAVHFSTSPMDTMTVDYMATGGTATAGGMDYTLVDGILIFEPNQITPETISIVIVDDDLAEDDETIVVTLSNPVNAKLAGRTEHTFTILDDDTTPTVELESTQSSVLESVGSANIYVGLSRAFKHTVTVDYAVTGGTATGDGVDYILEPGTLAFNAYETAKDISITIISDQSPEGNETIEVTLSNPINATLGSNTQHTYTIRDGFANSIGMEFVHAVHALSGTFTMGSGNGDFDEEPVHDVTISQPFYMSIYEVTNAQYEQFDPDHALIDHRGFSREPDEAVIFVSWEDANAFCGWLSDLEGLPYRLPTEAEWEYACRAGTPTNYHTGDTLDDDYYNERNQGNTTGPNPQPLHVGTALPNTFGLYDMHGNVEEWCYDWYGPYDANDQTDPVGTVDTGVKVTRGGSHSTPTYFLRSANRMGTTPDDKHWLIGFRVVLAQLPPTEPLPVALQTYQKNVSQQIPPDIEQGPYPDVPYFYGPRKYVHIPSELDGGPLFSNHNHVPGIVECPNGDLLAIWYSTKGERDRLLNVAGSRLRYGQDQWEEASVFWNAPDRNDHCPQVWLDEETGTIYHFNGLADAYSWAYLATVLRTSTDNGVTWSKPRLIMPVHDYRHMPIETIFRASDGSIILPCDAVPGGGGGTALWISPDDGLTWYDPGSNIAGIHAGVAQLTDGRFLAFGRGDNIDGMMPMSISPDMGQSWTYSPSPFPPIGSGRRLVLIRLREGPLFFASFGPNGLFGCVSYDDGDTWTPRRLITDDGPGTPVETMDGRIFTMSIDNAEPKGYLSVHQARNGVIHLISSRQHYAFNYKWLVDNACIVGFDDLAQFSEQWLASNPNVPADLDGSGTVDFADYSTLANSWLALCPDDWPLK